MPTGLPILDKTLFGLGITFYACTKGVGKTTLMLTAALATLRDCPTAAVLIVSFDEPKDRLYRKSFCITGGNDYRQLLAPNQDVMRRLKQAELMLAPLPRAQIVSRRGTFSPPRPKLGRTGGKRRL